MSRSALLAGLAVAAVLAAAGCGGSGGGGGGGKTMTKAQYASSLTHLCLSASDQVRELHLDNTIASWKADGDQVIAIDEHFRRQLNALKPPDEIKTAAHEYAAANDRALADTKVAVAAAKAGNAKKLHAALAKANTDDLSTWPPAKEIGAKGCYIS